MMEKIKIKEKVGFGLKDGSKRGKLQRGRGKKWNSNL